MSEMRKEALVELCFYAAVILMVVAAVLVTR